MDDDANKNDKRDSSGGRISSQRRHLADIAIKTVTIGSTIERLSKLVDRIPSNRRQLEILVACDQIAALRESVRETEMHLRDVATDTHEERYVVPKRLTWMERLSRFLIGDLS